MQTTAPGSELTTVDLCVEYVCGQGCLEVLSFIETLQAGQMLSVVSHLSAADRSAVLAELVSIMSVYEGTCDR